ncbi:unnamed protein product [Effrenium voratum]|nr:unnamed protein product [Effrenium voratum]
MFSRPPTRVERTFRLKLEHTEIFQDATRALRARRALCALCAFLAPVELVRDLWSSGLCLRASLMACLSRLATWRFGALHFGRAQQRLWRQKRWGDRQEADDCVRCNSVHGRGSVN